MSDTWQPVPRKLPYRCRRTGQDAESQGPYFEESLGYCEAPGDDRELTLYHSAQWLEHMASQPGSPFVVMSREQSEGLYEKIHALEVSNDDLRQALDEAEAAAPTAPPQMDADALADAITRSLEEHFVRKGGRKAA